MKIKNILLLGIAVATISSCATSKQLKMADDLYEKGSYYNSADKYAEVHEKKENNTRVMFQIAESNNMLKDYVEAEKWYTKTLENNPNAWPEARIANAMMMKAQGNYDGSKDEFKLFLEETADSKDKDGSLAKLRRKAKLEIQGCDLAQELMSEKQESEVTTISGLNNPLQDYSPKYLSENEILMAALLTEEAINLDEARDANTDYYSKLFVASNGGDSWSNELLPENINVPGLHNGNGVYTEDRSTLYYTQCAEVNAFKMSCNIYRSSKNGDAWGDPEMLSINKANSSTTQPALGMDAAGNEVLYFVSSRAGSKGGMDLYYATLDEDGNLGSATNMGSDFNTKYDEVTPFYDAKNSMLYFSSNGFPGMGGLDVFKAEVVEGEWSEIVNGGYPLNSSADDLYLALNERGSKGYMVSNRPGTTSDRGETCCDDVFKVKLKTDKYVLVQATDSKGALLDAVDVSLYAVNGENDFDFINEGITGDDEVVFFLEEADYKLNGNKEGYWPSIENVNMAEITEAEEDTILKVLVLEAINRATVENVYFAFDMNEIREMYQDEMDTVIALMMKYEEIILKIEGHTDSKGSDSYNMVLSERRSNAAKEYIIEQGIDEERILTRGYGETKPIALNENPDGSDNELGRAKNRRVEFKILNDVNEDLPIEIEYEAQDPESND